VREGGPYLWKKFFSTGHDMISAIKFNQDASKIVAAFSVFDAGGKSTN